MNEREIGVWLRSHGPEHLRGAHPKFDILRAAIGFYADRIAAKVGGIVASHARFDERRDPTEESLQRAIRVNAIVSEMARALPIFLRITVSEVSRIDHLARFTGVVVMVCVKRESMILGAMESARYILVNFEQVSFDP